MKKLPMSALPRSSVELQSPSVTGGVSAFSSKATDAATAIMILFFILLRSLMGFAFNERPVTDYYYASLTVCPLPVSQDAAKPEFQSEKGHTRDPFKVHAHIAWSRPGELFQLPVQFRPVGREGNHLLDVVSSRCCPSVLGSCPSVNWSSGGALTFNRVLSRLHRRRDMLRYTATTLFTGFLSRLHRRRERWAHSKSNRPQEPLPWSPVLLALLLITTS